MIRSRSNEAARPAQHNETKKDRRANPIRETRSEIESLAGEHRRLVFWLLKETWKNQAVLFRRMLAVIVSTSLLLASLALIPAILRTGAGFTSLPSPGSFALGEVVAAVLLTSSLAFALYGTALDLPSGLALSIPAEAIPRQQVLSLVQSDLPRLRQATSRAAWALRWSALLFLAALLPYLFIVLLLVL